MDLGTVHDAQAQLGNGRHVGRIVNIELVLVADLIHGQHGGYDGEDHQERQNPGSNHGGLVLGKAAHGVLHEGAGLGFQSLIVEMGVHLYELEFFLRDMLKFVIHTHFFDPILIRGSIRP